MAILPKVKLKALVSFPSNVYGGTGIEVSKENGAFTVDLDYSEFAKSASMPSGTYTLVWDPIANYFALVPPTAVGGISDAPTDGKTYGRRSAAWVDAWASPVLTGNPTAPTPTAGDNDTSIATTAFVTSALTAAGGALPSNDPPAMDGLGAPGASALYSRGDHQHPVDTSRAPASHTHAAADVTDFSEAVDDRVAGLLVAGANVTLTYDDPSNTLTIAASGGGGGGSGDVVGPAGAVADRVAVFNGTTGKIIKDGGKTIAEILASGGGGTGDVVGPASAVNNNFAAFNTTTGKLIKDSGSSSSSFATPASVSTAISGAAVRYDAVQGLTAPQQAQGRANIGASSPQEARDGVIAIKVFATSGTYTPSANMTTCVVECVGGGGGGGGAASGSAGNSSAASGGAAAGFARKKFTAAQIGASQSFTIGAGGSFGAAGNNNGGVGGNTVFGSLSAAGGSGAYGSAPGPLISNGGAPGGSSSGGDLNVAGMAGCGGIVFSVSGTAAAMSGFGGSGPYGGGGMAVSNGAGGAGSGFGSGGSGAACFHATGAFAGGAGAPGAVIVTEYGAV